MVTNLVLFVAGFFYMFLKSMNIWQIANARYIGMFIVGTLITFTWTYIVKQIVISGFWIALVYSIFAGLGTCAGRWAGERIHLKWGDKILNGKKHI